MWSECVLCMYVCSITFNPWRLFKAFYGSYIFTCQDRVCSFLCLLISFGSRVCLLKHVMWGPIVCDLLCLGQPCLQEKLVSQGFPSLAQMANSTSLILPLLSQAVMKGVLPVTIISKLLLPLFMVSFPRNR